MSKAIQGGILLGIAGGLLIAATGGLGAAAEGALMSGGFLTAHLAGTITALALSGASMEAGAIADALSSNRGSNITIRQPAAYRQVILGMQRVGGVLVYASTTGAMHDHFHRVIVLAGHVSHSVLNLYLDGRKVYWGGTGDGYQTRNGVTFGGWCDSQDHIGPDGATYNFGGNLVYAEVRYGDQAPGDVMTSLRTNDPSWAPTADGSPYLGGCTYVYLQISTSPTQFPSGPNGVEIRFDVNGRQDIYDPRSNTSGFSTNWALLVNRVMTDPVFGLGMDTTEINQPQLIAAANVCDELVPLANGGSEVRYACNYKFDTSVAPGDLLTTMMTAAAGRLSRIGGEWYIWPAYWQGPSYAFDKRVLLDLPNWEPYQSLAARFNRVTGTYTAPNYPYNAAGNVYDSSGWYDGTEQNNFQFAFETTNYPMFAMDALHGYPSDQWLAADGGHPLPKEISMPCTLSIAQAQRVAKIYLMRCRYEGRGSLICNLGAFGLQPTDVLQLTFPEYLGWQDKELEVTDFTFHIEERGGGDQSKALQVWTELKVSETGPDIYSWSTTEELSPYNVPAGLQQAPYAVAPPTNLTIGSTTSTGSNPGIGGNSTNYALLIGWNQPLDAQVTQIEIQAKLHSSSSWTDGGIVSVLSPSTLVYGVNQGSAYDVRIRSVRSNGAASVWVERDNYTV